MSIKYSNLYSNKNKNILKSSSKYNYVILALILTYCVLMIIALTYFNTSYNIKMLKNEVKYRDDTVFDTNNQESPRHINFYIKLLLNYFFLISICISYKIRNLYKIKISYNNI